MDIRASRSQRCEQLDIEATLLRERARAEAYSLLSACYYPPDEELLTRLQGADAAASAPFVASLQTAVVADDPETLRVEHARLFVGPFKVFAPPYGSVYFEDGRCMGESTVDVKALYRAEGLSVVLKEPPDHICAELEFMHVLVTNGMAAVQSELPDAIAASLQKQRHFLTTHLSAWVPDFVSRIREHAKTRFYQDLATATEEFVGSDAAFLSETPTA